MPGSYVGETVGQLIALPGEHMALTPAGFTVNGRALDPENFPVPASLRGQTARAEHLEKMNILLLWSGARRPRGAKSPPEVAIARLRLRAARDVLARGVMRWFPMRKRGFLKELE